MTTGAKVLLVDDDKAVRLAGRQALELAGFSVECFEAAEGVPARLSWSMNGVLLSDIKMPNTDGLTLMRQALAIDPEFPVVLITGHGDVAMAVSAMRAGAYDFIEKPFASQVLVDVTRRALEKRRLVLENRSLRAELEGPSSLNSVILGKTEVMERLRQETLMLAQTDVDVLITGETGTGKELVARALRDFGPRGGKPFVAVNCGALPASIIESELFGHEAGAFTGAVKRRIGKFEHADGGTLFLDEIESMPLELQVRLLRVLQERSIERLGSNRAIGLDLRVVAATKRDLHEACAAGAFREDLFYRLAVAPLRVPPLRERAEDLPLLFQNFLLRAAQRLRRDPPQVSSESSATLLAHSWPGNVRELQNAAERVALGMGLEAGGPAQAMAGSGPGLPERVEAFERSVIEQELARHGGNVTATCEALALPRKTLYDKIQKYRLRPADFRGRGQRSAPD